MFICNYCRENCLKNSGLGIVKSRGACEVCKYYDICTDVHGYTFLSNWEELKYKEKKLEL